MGIKAHSVLYSKHWPLENLKRSEILERLNERIPTGINVKVKDVQIKIAHSAYSRLNIIAKKKYPKCDAPWIDEAHVFWNCPLAKKPKCFTYRQKFQENGTKIPQPTGIPP